MKLRSTKQRREKNFLINIQKKLNIVENSNTREEKIHFLEQLYDSLIQKMDIVKQYPAFYEVSRQKLLFFHVVNQWYGCRKYFKAFDITLKDELEYSMQYCFKTIKKYTGLEHFGMEHYI
jgi:hypothetical protein